MCRVQLTLNVALLSLGLFAQMGPSAASQVEGDAIDEAQLRNKFERLCSEESRDYDRRKCEEWWQSLKDREKQFLKDTFLTGDDEPDDGGDIGAAQREFPREDNAREIAYLHYQGDYRLKRSRIGVLHWEWTVTHQWCSDSVGIRITGCYNSWATKREGPVWDYIKEDEVARRTTARDGRGPGSITKDTSRGAFSASPTSASPKSR